MNLNHYVYRTLDLKCNPVYYNSVTDGVFPITADEAELRRNFCLEGQERDALSHVLFERRSYPLAVLGVAPNWTCNLRCTHCVVADRLTETSKYNLDVNKVVGFVKRWFHDRPLLQNLRLDFCGGENLLVAEKCNEILDRLDETRLDYAAFMASNLTLDLTEERLALLSRLKGVTISLDGIASLHNAQRLPLHRNFDAFDRTVANLKRLIFAGFLPKLGIQACLPDEVCTPENVRSFLRLAFSLGFKKSQIRIGTAFPTKSKPTPTSAFINEIKTLPFHMLRCCKYRYNQYHTDWSGGVFSDFYSYHPLGTLDDSIDVLEERKSNLNHRIEVLTDPKCQQCPVVGFCWAGCSKLEKSGRNWSEFCSQETLIDYVKQKGDALLGWRA